MGMMPKRPRHRPRGSIVAAIDVGSTKIACFLARVEDDDRLQPIGIGHQLSQGVKSGAIVDMEAATAAIAQAVNAAEQMAGETIQEAMVNLSGAHVESHPLTVEVAISGHQVGDLDLRRALASARQVEKPGETEIVHAIPVGYAIDGMRGIEEPRGMFGQTLGVQLHAIAANSGAVRTLGTCVADAHLNVEGVCVGSYASGLATLVDDEMDLGCVLIDMGGGTTEIGVFVEGVCVHVDCVPVGGAHVTRDVASGLSTSLTHAERIKTLYGAAFASSADERELIDVPQIGEPGDTEHPNHLPRSFLTSIIQPRLEETFEMVRGKLEASGFQNAAGRRVVLTGGASQLAGVRELAQLILDKQVRLARPFRVPGLAENAAGPAFATAAGLLRFAARMPDDLKSLPAATPGPTSLIGRVGHWLRENL
jgi:cell division protein FtsA